MSWSLLVVMVEKRKTWIGSVVVESKEFERSIEFWKAALGFVERGKRDPQDDFVVLHDPTHASPNISLQKVSDAPNPDYRFHFDLYSTAPEAEVKRLEGLGARLTEPFQEGRDFATLLDPDGNPFDVLDFRGEKVKFGERFLKPVA